jgi:hypothetical protein
MLVQILVQVYPVQGLVQGLHSSVVQWTVLMVDNSKGNQIPQKSFALEFALLV